VTYSLIFDGLRRLAPGLAAAAILSWTEPVLAQMPGRLPGEANGVFQWVIVLLIAVLFGAVVFMNPKRTHQD